VKPLAVADIPRLSQGALEIVARRAVEGLYSGRHRSPFTGSAVEFSDHRPYQPGDDLRAVDWKAYGRSDHLLIRRYREERDLPLVLVLDASASMDYGDPHKGEWARVALAALALLAIDQGDRVRVVIDGVPVTGEVGGPGALPQVCAALDAVRWHGGGDAAASAGALASLLTRRTLVVFLGDLLGDAATLAKPFGALAGRGHELAAIQVLDRSELALPAAWGACAIRDPEGRVADLACDAASAKAAYDAAMQAHLSVVRQTFAGCRADHHLAATDSPVADALGVWLHRRRRR
jgi:uncharacterized protein (DUF58 family)